MASFYTLSGRCMIGIFLIALGACTREPLRPEVVIVRQPSDIRPVADPQSVAYLLYDVEYDLSSLPVDEKKEKFIAIMLPSVLAVKFNLDKEFNRVDEILRKLHNTGEVSGSDSAALDSLAKVYKAGDWFDLRRRLKAHPVSIVLAQAAVESGWGSSRFFLEANNIFGVWSFDPDEQRIRAEAYRGNNAVYLRSYRNTAASIADYYQVIARSFAYRKFRDQRLKSDDALKLIPYLSNYSELRSEYVRKLRAVIVQNQLQKYDSSRLDRRYTRGIGKLFY